MLELLFYSLIAGLFSLAGGLLLLAKPKLTHRFITPLLAFGAGAFLAAAFLHVLPEALEHADDIHPVFLALLGGFMGFFILERLIMKYRPHEPDHHHSEHTEPLAFLVILGDSLHNLLDGIVLGLAYLVNPLLGLPTALAIAAHEIPQEMGEFAILMKLGWKKKAIIAVNIAQSLLTIPGVFLGFYLGQALDEYLPFLLAGTAGIFIYIAASDLIPEIHHQAGHKHLFRVALPMLLAIVLIFFLSELAHSH
jgi:zinc and cadmium transporter